MHKRCKNEIYDTLDDTSIDVSSNVEEIHKLVIPNQEDVVGVLLSGRACFSSTNEGYWGRQACLATGETIQIRVYPRDSIGVPLQQGEPRMIGFRRKYPASQVVRVGFAILFLPLNEFETPKVPVGHKGYARTIGCRSMQVIIPSLFDRHDPTSKSSRATLNVDSDFYGTVRPHTFTTASMSKILVKSKIVNEVSFSVNPGISYLTIAGHMCGVKIEEDLCRTTVNVTQEDHLKHTLLVQRRIENGVGRKSTERHVSAAFTLLELLCAEGILSIPCSPFFSGCLPDAFMSPMGLSLLLVMASRLACFPERYEMQSCTKHDEHANLEIAGAFDSRWTVVLRKNLRAIDLAIKNGHDTACAHIKKESDSHACHQGLSIFITDNLTFWQRVGQRINIKMTSECIDSARRRRGVSCDDDPTRDPISEAKYSAWARENTSVPILEQHVNEIFLASRADAKNRLYHIQDDVELWLREGVYNDEQVSEMNVNVAGRKRSECTSSSSEDEEEDNDYIIDHQINVAAMERAASTIAIAMIHGPCVFHQFGMQSFLVGKSSFQQCADCGAKVGVLSTIIGSRASKCTFCGHYRCPKCEVLASERVEPVMCRYCNHSSKLDKVVD